MPVVTMPTGGGGKSRCPLPAAHLHTASIPTPSLARQWSRPPPPPPASPLEPPNAVKKKKKEEEGEWRQLPFENQCPLCLSKPVQWKDYPAPKKTKKKQFKNRAGAPTEA